MHAGCGRVAVRRRGIPAVGGHTVGDAPPAASIHLRSCRGTGAGRHRLLRGGGAAAVGCRRTHVAQSRRHHGQPGAGLPGDGQRAVGGRSHRRRRPHHLAGSHRQRSQHRARSHRCQRVPDLPCASRGPRCHLPDRAGAAHSPVHRLRWPHARAGRPGPAPGRGTTDHQQRRLADARPHCRQPGSRRRHTPAGRNQRRGRSVR